MDKFKKGGPKRLHESPLSSSASFAEIFPSKKPQNPLQTRTIPTASPRPGVPQNIQNSTPNPQSVSAKKPAAYVQSNSRYQQSAASREARSRTVPHPSPSPEITKNSRNNLPSRSYTHTTQTSQKIGRHAQTVQPKPQEPNKLTPYPRMSLKKKILYSVFSFLSVMVLAISGLAWSFQNTLQNGIGRANLHLGGINDGAIDILLVGLDSRTDAQGNPLSPALLRELHAQDNDPSLNTDTIILLRIPTNGRSAIAISLPRDTYVTIPGIGKAKLNSAYGSTYEKVLEEEIPQGIKRSIAENDAKQAGRKALITTVENLTGVTVDHYAEIGLEGFAQLTDALGGVKVCLNHRVYDPYSGANFHRGIQTLNGAQALSFVRQRHGLPHEDIDRIKRQQVFMAYIAHHILSTDILTNPTKINQLTSAVEDSIVIDKGWNIADLATRLSALAAGQIKFATIPIENEAGWSDDNTQSVVKVDPVAVRKWVSALVTDPQTPQGRVPVDIFNAGSIDGLASTVSGILQNKGFLEGNLQNGDPGHTTSSMVLYHGKTDEAENIAEILGIHSQADPTLPANKVQIILTDSYQGPGTPQYTNTHQNLRGSSIVPGPNAIAPHMINAGGNSGIRCVD